jgi:hypothetical protein
MNETRISIPVKCRFPTTKSKEVERERSEQNNAGQGKARQSRERTGQGGQGGNEIFGSIFRQTRCSLQNAGCGPPMDLSEPYLLTYLQFSVIKWAKQRPGQNPIDVKSDEAIQI